jgi:hypothetical protein
MPSIVVLVSVAAEMCLLSSYEATDNAHMSLYLISRAMNIAYNFEH